MSAGQDFGLSPMNKGNHERFKIEDDVIRFPFGKDCFD